MSDYDVNLGSSLFNFNAYDALHSLNDEFFVLKLPTILIIIVLMKISN